MFLSYKINQQITNALLRNIIKTHFPDDQLEKVAEIEGSFVNPVFKFQLKNNTSYILKFNNPRWPYKQEREINAIKLVQTKTSIPVPKIIIEHSILNADDLAYMILERAPGLDFRGAIATDQLTGSEILKIIEKTGYYLGEMHSIKFDFFGDISDNHLDDTTRDSYFWGKRFSKWSDCFKAFCMDILFWVDKQSFPQYRAKLIEKINDYANNQPEPETASFIHSDIQPSNIIISDKQISALIDFEWAFAGSPCFEYSITRAGFYFSVFPSLSPSGLLTNYPDITKETIDQVFLRGYKSANIRRFLEPMPDLTDFIWLLYMIGSWDWSIQTSTLDEVKKYEQDIHDLYSKLIG